MKHNKIKKRSGRVYVRTIQKVYNNQIDLFNMIYELECDNTFINDVDVDVKTKLITKSIKNLDMLKIWLDDLEPHIDFKINEDNFEDNIKMVLKDYESFQRSERIKEGLKLSKIKN